MSPKSSTVTRRPGTAGAARERWLDAVAQRPTAVFLVLLVVASTRVIATYSVFNHTVDEPAHIACGMEWLDNHRYTLETQHPPLARVSAALGPYLAGSHAYGKKDIHQEGAAILYGGQQYDRTLALARFGILPYFWMLALAVFWWTRARLGGVTGILALLILTATPALLAHAGVATTDMALTACLVGAFLIGVQWLEEPSMGWSALLGLVSALALLSKLSSIPFFVVSALVALALWWYVERPEFRVAAVTARIVPALVAAAVCVFTVWAGYRFSTGRTWLIAPEFFDGIQFAASHNRSGHISYLLGDLSQTGFWCFYPVALAVKTPLGLLLLAVWGVWFWWRERRSERGLWVPAALGAGVLIVGMISNINIGTRHVLPVYVVVAIFAAFACERALRSSSAWMKWSAMALLAWGITAPAIEHPDYLSYFNELAGGQPERILVDSDLDWGQDMKRLAARLHEVGAQSVSFQPFIVAHLERVHGFPPIHPASPDAPMAGWNAVSLTVLKLTRMGLGPEEKIQPWPDRFPASERVGKSVLLYHFPER
jgi:hypothetical protein